MILSMDIKTIANKKARGIMPLIEGKSPYHFLVMLKLLIFARFSLLSLQCLYNLLGT